jgi:hypothetical protein
MTERHLIAWAILLVLLAGAVLLWRLTRRPRGRGQAAEPHLRIDLLSEQPEEKGKP